MNTFMFNAWESREELLFVRRRNGFIRQPVEVGLEIHQDVLRCGDGAHSSTAVLANVVGNVPRQDVHEHWFEMLFGKRLTMLTSQFFPKSKISWQMLS